MFNGFFKALKPSGVPGLVEDCAKPNIALAKQIESGAMTAQFAIEAATGAGFRLDQSAAINRNPRDTKDYPGGVSLPLNLLGAADIDKPKYRTIGESDRMTLRCVKL